MKFIIKFFILVCIILMDIAGTFSFSDIPFVGILLIVGEGRNIVFGFALAMLIWMGLSYIPTGAGLVTERIGEWFYIFFMTGLVRYIYEMYRLRK